MFLSRAGSGSHRDHLLTSSGLCHFLIVRMRLLLLSHHPRPYRGFPLYPLAPLLSVHQMPQQEKVGVMNDSDTAGRVQTRHGERSPGASCVRQTPVAGVGGRIQRASFQPFRPTSSPNPARCGFADTTRERGSPTRVRHFIAPRVQERAKRSERSERLAVLQAKP